MGEESGIQKLHFSFFPFFQINLKGDDDYLASIDEIHDLVEKSPLKGKAFVHGHLFTYWEVFRSLDKELYKTFAADLGVILFFTLMMLRSRLAGLISAFACGLIVVEVFGVCTLFTKFNIFVAAAILMGMGMSIEFTAHTAAAFSQASRSPLDSLATAMRHTFPAILEGSLSTLLGILPMAFSDTIFEVKYFSAIFTLIIVVGMLNGFLCLPAFLALLGCAKNDSDSIGYDESARGAPSG